MKAAFLNCRTKIAILHAGVLHIHPAWAGNTAPSLASSSSTLSFRKFFLITKNSHQALGKESTLSYVLIQQTFIKHLLGTRWGFPGGVVVKNPTANSGDARDTGSIPGSGRSPGLGNGNHFQYSCLENSMNRAVW